MLNVQVVAAFAIVQLARSLGSGEIKIPNTRYDTTADASVSTEINGHQSKKAQEISNSPFTCLSQEEALLGVNVYIFCGSATREVRTNPLRTALASGVSRSSNKPNLPTKLAPFHSIKDVTLGTRLDWCHVRKRRAS
jgi:hypothetical protein